MENPQVRVWRCTNCRSKITIHTDENGQLPDDCPDCEGRNRWHLSRHVHTEEPTHTKPHRKGGGRYLKDMKYKSLEYWQQFSVPDNPWGPKVGV